MLDRVRSGWLGKCICLPGELHIIMAWNKMEALRPWFQALIDNMSRGITICPSNKDKFLVFFCLFVWLLQHIIPVFLKASSWSVEWVFFFSFFLSSLKNGRLSSKINGLWSERQLLFRSWNHGVQVSSVTNEPEIAHDRREGSLCELPVEKLAPANETWPSDPRMLEFRGRPSEQVNRCGGKR